MLCATDETEPALDEIKQAVGPVERVMRMRDRVYLVVEPDGELDAPELAQRLSDAFRATGYRPLEHARA